MMILPSYFGVKGNRTAVQERRREVATYLVFGLLTTLINFVVFYLLQELTRHVHVRIPLFGYAFDIVDPLINSLAWLAAVIFAYLTNRRFVFCSDGPFFKEWLSFVSSRIATWLILEVAVFSIGIYLMETLFEIPKTTVLLSCSFLRFDGVFFVKLLVGILVVVSNYLLSKRLVFRTQQTADSDDGTR